MEKVVVDTDIIIDFLRTQAGLFLQLLKFQNDGVIEIYYSSITIMELYAGEMKDNEEKMLSDLLVNFKVITFDRELAKFTGEMKKGTKLGTNLADYIIGATSIFIKAKLVTRNTAHFQGIKSIRFFELPASTTSN